MEVSVALAEGLVLEREGAALKWKRDREEVSSTEGLMAELEPTTQAADAEPVVVAAAFEALWNTEKAESNRRHIELLSEGLEASEIHDLQVLLSSLERQASDKSRLIRTKDADFFVDEVGCSAEEKGEGIEYGRLDILS